MTAKPKLAIVVQSKIAGDSRIQKAALNAARAGWQVVIIGLDGIGNEPRTWLGPVRVVRRGLIRRNFKASEDARRRVWGPWLPTAYPSIASARRAGRDLTRTMESKREKAFSPTAKALAEAEIFVRRVVHKARRVAAARHTMKPLPPPGNADWRKVDWRTLTPIFLDWKEAFAPVIVAMQPDVVHSNDPAMIGVAADAVEQLRAQGHQVGWIHDMHEHVSAVDWGVPAVRAGYVAHEAEYIHKPDRLVTVSPEIAEALRDEYDLESTPFVVRNAPVGGMHTPDAPSLRTLVGLPPEAKIVVSSGSIDPKRGITTAIDALPQLPDAHLVVVTKDRIGLSEPLTALLQRADEMGVSDRVHLAPYVTPDEICEYLSSADVGLFAGIHYPNYEKSLPTKFAEYLHAGLPLLVSDLRVPGAFVRDHGVGEVFRAEDADDLAAALRRLLDDLPRYREAITPELLEEHSWQYQGKTFLDLYSQVSAVQPQAPENPPVWEVSESYHGPLEDPWPTIEPVRPPLEALTTPTRLVPPDNDVRLLVAPANHAGQGWLWARAAERELGIGARAFAPTRPKSFRFPTDYTVFINTYLIDPVWTNDMRRDVLTGFTHVLREAEQGLFNAYANLDQENAELAARGIATAVMLHGSEIRNPAAHARRHACSPFHLHTHPELQELAETNAARLAKFDGPIFVSTPDLLEDVPRATWCPVTVDLDLWAAPPRPERDIPVVLHAPSRGGLKGSDLVEPVLEELHEAGIVEYRIVRGVLHETMPGRIGEADIVLDQFRLASYGVAACEAMAGGAISVGHVSESVRSHVRETTGLELPIVEATGDTLRQVIIDLAQNRDQWSAQRAAGLEFVRTVHDGTLAARALAPFLGVTP